jgi:hypothetical protein
MSMMGLRKFALCAVVVMGICGIAGAVESTTVNITAIQVDGSQVVIWVSSNTPCNCNGYRINLNSTNGQEMYELALSAYNTGASVRIHVASVPCNWGTNITGIKLMPN